MPNSVDPDETAHMSRLIWIFTVCKSLLLLPVAVKVLKGHSSLLAYTGTVDMKEDARKMDFAVIEAKSLIRRKSVLASYGFRP